MPLNFAVLLTSLVAGHDPGRPPRGRARRPPSPGTGRLAADFAWFVGAYAPQRHRRARRAPEALAVAYVVVWIPRIAMREERAILFPFGVALALAGCVVEAAEIELGWFSYADPEVIGVPFWLAGIYLHGAPLALDVARRVDAAGLAPRWLPLSAR